MTLRLNFKEFWCGIFVQGPSFYVFLMFSYGCPGVMVFCKEHAEWWLGFPHAASGKESICQCWRCERPGFDPWVWKIPWRREWQPTSVFLPETILGKEISILHLLVSWLVFLFFGTFPLLSVCLCCVSLRCQMFPCPIFFNLMAAFSLVYIYIFNPSLYGPPFSWFILFFWVLFFLSVSDVLTWIHHSHLNTCVTAIE